MGEPRKKYDFYMYSLIVFVGMIITSLLSPLIGETAENVIYILLFCTCTPIVVWMRWQNRKIDKQNADD